MTSGAGAAAAARGVATVQRLLDAATTLLCSGGAAAVSVQRVADVAGTSKALVHYHFAAKDALLVACVERVGTQLVGAESAAVGTIGAVATASALDDVWRAMMAPPVVAWRRALLALTTDASPATHASLTRARTERQRGAVRLIDAVARAYGLSLPVARAALAAAFIALLDGLTLVTTESAASAESREAFDAFWLAVLSLDR